MAESGQNYEKSEEYLTRAKDVIQEIQRKFLLQSIVNKANAKINIIDFVKNHWFGIIIWGIIIFFFIKIDIFMVNTVMLNKRLEKLTKEQETISSMMKQSQIDYYKNSILDKETFIKNAEESEKRQEEIKDEITMTNKKLSKNAQKFEKVKESIVGKLKKIGIIR